MTGPAKPLTALAQVIRKINVRNGWRTGDEDKHAELIFTDVHYLLARLMLIATEVAEAAEVVRQPGGWTVDSLHFEEELADVLIRTLDLADELGFDMDAAIALKLAKNATRGYRHG